MFVNQSYPLLVVLALTTALPAQKRSPLANDPNAVRAGESEFRINCSFCHGLGARGGGRGPGLTRAQKRHGNTDADGADRRGAACVSGCHRSDQFLFTAFNPQTNLLYVSTNEGCDIFMTAPQKYQEGNAYYGSAYFPAEGEGGGSVRAIDPLSGKIRWEFHRISTAWSGVLSTAGGIVFTGDAEGNVIELDAASGKILWHFQTGGDVHSSPMAFAVDGKEYVAVAAGSALYTFSLPEGSRPPPAALFTNETDHREAARARWEAV